MVKVSVFTIAVISVMLSVSEYVQTVEQANLFAVIAFGMVGMNILVFYLINDIMEREVKMHENRVFQIQAKNQLEMYRLSLDMKMSEQQHAIASVLGYLLVKVILFFLILVIRKRFAKKSMERMLDTEWLRFLFLP